MQNETNEEREEVEAQELVSQFGQPEAGEEGGQEARAEVGMADEELSMAVKALEETEDYHRIGGYGVVWGGKDLVGDSFSQDTDFWFDRITETPLVMYDHGRDGEVKRTVLSKVGKKNADDTGLWIEAQLAKSDKYAKLVMELVKKGVIGWSSGAVPHLVQKESGQIRSWPIVEFSLTPTPCEPRTLGVQELRSIAELEPAVKALLPEDAPAEDVSADALMVESEAPESETKSTITGVKDMAEEKENVVQESPVEVTDEMLDKIAAKMGPIVKEAVEAQLKALPAVNEASKAGVITPDTPGVDQAAAMKAFDTYLLTGSLDEALKVSYQMDSDLGGGYLIPPQQFMSELIKELDDLVYVRGRSRKFTCKTADSMGFPKMGTRAEDTDWTSELATGEEEDTMNIKKREFRPHPLAKRLKISNKLLRAAPSASQLFMEELSYKRSITEEKAFLEGHGSEQPLGVFAASDLGISTSRDFTCTASTSGTLDEADDIIDAKFDLKPQYWKNAIWIMHRDVVALVSKIKDGTSNYLWDNGLRSGKTWPTLAGFPVLMSEYAPNTISAGNYVAILGDFRYFWIVDALDMTIQVLKELYAETNQTGYIVRSETDAMPVLEEAFVRIKLGS